MSGTTPRPPAERAGTAASTQGRGRGRLPVEAAVRVGVLLFVVYLAVAIVRPFLGILIWSTVLAVTLYPVFHWVRRWTGGSGTLAAVLVTLAGLALVIGPVAFLCTSLVRSLQQLLLVVLSGDYTLPALPAAITSLPAVGDDIEEAWTRGGSNLIAFLKEHAHSLVVPGEWLLGAIASLAGIVLTLALAVAVAGFLFLPGPRLAAVANDVALRIGGPHSERFVALAAATIRTVGRGIVGISVLQSLLIGSVFLLAQVPQAGLLTLLVLILSIIQVGPVYVAVSVAGWIWLARPPLEAAAVTAALVAIIAAENFAKPMVLGRGSETPTLVLFLGVFGGLTVYGLAGLFIGPVVFAVCFEVVRSWLSQTPEAPPPGAADNPGRS